jgi:hypothetical protein
LGLTSASAAGEGGSSLVLSWELSLCRPWGSPAYLTLILLHPHPPCFPGTADGPTPVPFSPPPRHSASAAGPGPSTASTPARTPSAGAAGTPSTAPSTSKRRWGSKPATGMPLKRAARCLTLDATFCACGLWAACGALWCLVVPCGALWCRVVPCGAVWCRVVPCGAVWCRVVPCGALWCLVVPCGALWYLVVHLLHVLHVVPCAAGSSPKMLAELRSLVVKGIPTAWRCAVGPATWMHVTRGNGMGWTACWPRALPRPPASIFCVLSSLAELYGVNESSEELNREGK